MNSLVRAGIAGAACMLVVAVVGCGSQTVAGSPTPATQAGQPAFDPCLLPDAALVAAGVDPATKDHDFFDVRMQGWNLCSWTADWYLLGVARRRTASTKYRRTRTTPTSHRRSLATGMPSPITKSATRIGNWMSLREPGRHDHDQGQHEGVARRGRRSSASWPHAARTRSIPIFLNRKECTRDDPGLRRIHPPIADIAGSFRRVALGGRRGIRLCACLQHADRRSGSALRHRF